MTSRFRQWSKEVSSKTYEIRSLAPGTEIMKETPWSRIQGTKQRVQNSWRSLQWESNGQCSRGDNCSFRHDVNKLAKVTQPNPFPNSFMQQDERKASRTRSPSKDYFKGTCTNSFCKIWHPSVCLFYKTKSGSKFGEKCSYAHRQVDEQPSKRSKNEW